jgi:uncharacterized OB-fold protein
MNKTCLSCGNDTVHPNGICSYCHPEKFEYVDVSNTALTLEEVIKEPAMQEYADKQKQKGITVIFHK